MPNHERTWLNRVFLWLGVVSLSLLLGFAAYDRARWHHWWSFDIEVHRATWFPNSRLSDFVLDAIARTEEPTLEHDAGHMVLYTSTLRDRTGTPDSRTRRELAIELPIVDRYPAEFTIDETTRVWGSYFAKFADRFLACRGTVRLEEQGSGELQARFDLALTVQPFFQDADEPPFPKRPGPPDQVLTQASGHALTHPFALSEWVQIHPLEAAAIGTGLAVFLAAGLLGSLLLWLVGRK
ncbi:MAG: hypothetical protein RL885_01965 [Planctomycetota bacterium]